MGRKGLCPGQGVQNKPKHAAYSGGSTQAAAGWWGSPLGDGAVLVSPQECLSQQQALGAVRQMQKLLVVQEAAHLRGTQGLRQQLSVLQSHLQRQATKRNGITGSPPWGDILMGPAQTSVEQPGQETPRSLPGWHWLQPGNVHSHPCLSVCRDLSAASSAPERTDAGPERAGGP